MSSTGEFQHQEEAPFQLLHHVTPYTILPTPSIQLGHFPGASMQKPCPKDHHYHHHHVDFQLQAHNTSFKSANDYAASLTYLHS